MNSVVKEILSYQPCLELWRMRERETMKRAIVLAFMTCLLGSMAVPAKTDSEKPVRISYLQSDVHHLPLWIALDKGIMKECGAAIEIAGVFKAGPETMTAFTAGSLDMAYVGEAPALTAVANKTAHVQVLAQVNTEGSAIVVGATSPIRRITDLRNKTVAIPGHSTVQDFLLRRALGRIGLSPEDVGIIVLKPPEMIGALRTNQVNAFIAWEPFPSKAVTQGVGKYLVASREIWKDHPCCAVVVDTRFLKNHRDKVKAVIAAHVKAIDFINKHPEEAVRVAMKYTGMDEETIRLALKNVTYTEALSIAGVEEYVNFLNEFKYIKIDDPKTFVAGFIEPKILEEVQNP
jgi:NitT/TauT family transport system substrate-binding protein